MALSSATFNLPDAEATHALGKYWGERLPAGTVLLLQGDLGTGKTALVKGVGAGLGIAEPVDSPTFTIINEYLGGRVPLYHADLYRLEGAEVDALYLETYWEGTEVEPGITAIEWAERLRFLPQTPLTIHLSLSESGGRQVTILPTTPLQAQLVEDLAHHALLAHEV